MPSALDFIAYSGNLQMYTTEVERAIDDWGDIWVASANPNSDGSYIENRLSYLTMIDAIGIQRLNRGHESLTADKREAFRFHHISTDEVFGELQLNDAPFTESTSYAPKSPYSASKAASDHLVRAWHEYLGN